ncbi:3-oxoacyl-ACP synthase III family protein [Rufibacter sp. LB8]|uniref:3-oxoacyl-ACP synthase III family protein n=1 Tax=Rufibacter sp. LB8 TaxID=2777781 RepID=UPI00178C7A14|nr:beta-ketoacyl-ACP synthase III [Rufibacter sp. LB8]
MTKQLRNSRIAGLGHYVPEKVIKNADLEKLMDTSDAWIVERTGIHERRYFEPGKDTTANMAANAARVALERAGLEAKDLDMIVFATLSPDYFFPGSGVLLQRELGISDIPCFDIRNQCSGFIYALSLGDQYIKSGMCNNVLVVGSEIQSSGLEFNDRGRSVSVIFGDGAGAAVLTPSDSLEKGILSTHLHAQGEFAEELAAINPSSNLEQRLTHEMIDDGSTYPYMNGSTVFKHAVTRFPEVIMEALNQNNVTPEDLDLIVPHQANLRITQFIQQKMKLPEGKIFSNIQKYGNTTAASVPIAFSEAFEEGRVKEGDLICLAAFGSGFTWASALIRW